METPLHNPYIVDHVWYTEGALTRHLDKFVKKKTRENIGKKIAKYIPFTESHPAIWKSMSKDPRYTTDITKACWQKSGVVYASQYCKREIVVCNVTAQRKDKDGNLVLDLTYYLSDGSGGIVRHPVSDRTGQELHDMLFDTQPDQDAKAPLDSR